MVRLMDLLAKSAVFAVALQWFLRQEAPCSGTTMAFSALPGANSRQGDFYWSRLNLWIKPLCGINAYGRYRRRFLRGSFRGNSGSCTSS
jgi:hypothetical protein